MPVRKRRQKGLKVSNLALLLVVFKWHHGSGGVSLYSMPLILYTHLYHLYSIPLTSIFYTHLQNSIFYTIITYILYRFWKLSWGNSVCRTLVDSTATVVFWHHASVLFIHIDISWTTCYVSATIAGISPTACEPFVSRASSGLSSMTVRLKLFRHINGSKAKALLCFGMNCESWYVGVCQIYHFLFLLLLLYSEFAPILYQLSPRHVRGLG